MFFYYDQKKKTIEMFDEFTKSSKKLMCLNRFALPVQIKGKRFEVYLIVTKSGAGYDKVEMWNSNITISDIKALSNSKKIKINFDTIADLLNHISTCPNISLPVYKLLLDISKIVTKYDMEIGGTAYSGKIKCNENIEEVTNWKEGIIINFSKPILLRAQIPSNRTGYGNYNEGSIVIEEGTHYGETTGFPIVACIVTSAYGYEIDENYKEIKKLLSGYKKNCLKK